MRHFNYPVEQLIKCMRERPVIWDKTLEIYKDREERKQAWEEIFRSLEDRFDEMSMEDKRIIGDLIINKWTNMRDTFIKSLKNQTSKSGTKRYLHHDEMSFLLKVMPPEIIPEFSDHTPAADVDPIPYNSTSMPNLKQEMNFDLSEEEAGTSMSNERHEAKRSKRSVRSTRKFFEPELESHPRRKRSMKSELHRQPEPESPSVDFVEMSEVNDPRVMNEDEAFFASLLPTIVKYSEDERLEFRIEVLAVMKRINDNRRHRWTDETLD